jgi:hypothetical protein
MALNELDFPTGIAQCSECHQHFCLTCAAVAGEEAGYCKTCHGILCPEGLRAAVRERRGECYNCWAAKEPEWEPEKPKIPEPATHCWRGHLLTAANTYEWAGVLRCRECNRIDDREYKRKRRAEAKARKAEQ